MISWAYVLFVTFFLAAVAAIFKAVRYATDTRLKGQWFYWLGVPANLALLTALLLIATSVGDEPYFSGYWIRLLMRSSFVVWAVLALIFEIMYICTYIKIQRNGNGYASQSVDTDPDVDEPAVTDRKTGDAMRLRSRVSKAIFGQ